MKKETFICRKPEETFAVAETLGKTLAGDEIILLLGGLGAGKTLFTKGIMSSLDFEIDEVNSPSFTLVNRYNAKFTVFHLDLWRLEGNKNVAFAVGLDELLEEKSIIIIEWAEFLEDYLFPIPTKIIRVGIEGDGDESRTIIIEKE